MAIQTSAKYVFVYYILENTKVQNGFKAGEHVSTPSLPLLMVCAPLGRATARQQATIENWTGAVMRSN